MSELRKPIFEPELSDVIAQAREDIFKSLNCAAPGKIISFDTTKKTAKIQLLFKRQLADDTVVSHPPLLDCPVFTLQGGGAALKFPIQAGDTCLVLFADRNLDAWFETGQEQVPIDSMCHHLTNGIALVGLNSRISTLATYKTDEVELLYGNAVIGLKGGKIRIKSGATDLLTALNLLIDAIKAITTTTSGDTVSGASQTALEAIKTTLGTVLYS